MKKEKINKKQTYSHPYLIMMSLFLGGFVGMFSETSLNIALPNLSEVFGVDTSIMQWMVIGYMLMIGLVLPFVSMMSKWFSIKKLVNFALGSFLVGSLVSAAAPNFTILLIGRIIQGIGTGIVLPIMFSLIIEVFPPQKIGKAMGLSALIIMFAPVIGPTLSGIILGTLSWRWIFILFALLLFIALIFANKYLINPYQITRPKLDLISMLTSVLGFGLIVLGAGLASLYGWISVPVILSLVVGVISLAIYSKRQLNMENPILNLKAFSISEFRTAAIIVMINFGITLSSMFLFPQFIQNAMLVPVALTGIIMLPGGIINAVISLVSGAIYDKIGAKIPAITGFILSIAGIILLLMAKSDTSLGYIIFSHIVLMIGVPMAMSPTQSAGLKSLPAHLSTDGSTILNTMQQVIGAVCTAIATSLLGMGQSTYLISNPNKLPEAFAHGSHLGFIFTLVLAVAGLVLSFRLKSNNKNIKNEQLKDIA